MKLVCNYSCFLCEISTNAVRVIKMFVVIIRTHRTYTALMRLIAADGVAWSVRKSVWVGCDREQWRRHTRFDQVK